MPTRTAASRRIAGHPADVSWLQTRWRGIAVRGSAVKPARGVRPFLWAPGCLFASAWVFLASALSLLMDCPLRFPDLIGLPVDRGLWDPAPQPPPKPARPSSSEKPQRPDAPCRVASQVAPYCPWEMRGIPRQCTIGERIPSCIDRRSQSDGVFDSIRGCTRLEQPYVRSVQAPRSSLVSRRHAREQQRDLNRVNSIASRLGCYQ